MLDNVKRSVVSFNQDQETVVLRIGNWKYEILDFKGAASILTVFVDAITPEQSPICGELSPIPIEKVFLMTVKNEGTTGRIAQIVQVPQEAVLKLSLTSRSSKPRHFSKTNHHLPRHLQKPHHRGHTATQSARRKP